MERGEDLLKTNHFSSFYARIYGAGVRKKANGGTAI
jgi:hypothetical protein